jgi:hypothetical protein
VLSSPVTILCAFISSTASRPLSMLQDSFAEIKRQKQKKTVKEKKVHLNSGRQKKKELNLPSCTAHRVYILCVVTRKLSKH